MAKIQITVNKKTGEINIETFDFTGNSCKKATETLESLLGNITDENFKEEFYLNCELNETINTNLCE